jgi:hypothetical protein
LGSLRSHSAVTSQPLHSHSHFAEVTSQPLRVASLPGVTSQSLCSHFIIATSQPLRGHFAVTSGVTSRRSLRSHHFGSHFLGSSLRSHFAVTPRPLCSQFGGHFGVPSQPLRSHFTVTATSRRSLCSHFGCHFLGPLRSRFAVFFIATSQPLRGHFAVTSGVTSRRSLRSHHFGCHFLGSLRSRFAVTS